MTSLEFASELLIEADNLLDEYARHDVRRVCEACEQAYGHTDDCPIGQWMKTAEDFRKWLLSLPKT